MSSSTFNGGFPSSIKWTRSVPFDPQHTHTLLKSTSIIDQNLNDPTSKNHLEDLFFIENMFRSLVILATLWATTMVHSQLLVDQDSGSILTQFKLKPMDVQSSGDSIAVRFDGSMVASNQDWSKAMSSIFGRMSGLQLLNGHCNQSQLQEVSANHCWQRVANSESGYPFLHIIKLIGKNENKGFYQDLFKWEQDQILLASAEQVESYQNGLPFDEAKCKYVGCISNRN